MSNRIPPTPYQAMQVIGQAREALTKLETEDGLVLDSPEAVLRALTEEDGPDVEWVLVNLARGALDAEASEEAASKRIDALRIREARFAKQRDTYRWALIQAMSALGLDTFKDAEFSLNLKNKGPVRVHVQMPENLPSDCIVTKTVSIPDKEKLRGILESGDQEAIDRLRGAAVLSNGAPVLTIRKR